MAVNIISLVDSVLMIIHLGKNPNKGGRPPNLNITIIDIKNKTGLFVRDKVSLEWAVFDFIIISMILHVITMYAAK